VNHDNIFILIIPIVVQIVKGGGII